MAKLFKNGSVKKKILAILTCALISVSSLAIFGACKKVEGIDITKKNMPQTVYVLGSDLNLTGGKLTVEIKGEKQEIDLSDPSISVTGYDKNKIGEQVLTVTYEEKTTLLKVTVVPRMVAAKYESAYFVGEPMNMEKGDFTITNDDGTSFVVPMDDETITVEGFSSAAANDALPLKATYAKDGVSYSVDFNVAVYAVAEVEFSAPNKKDYKDHETTLDVSGGYIALKSEKLTRYQQLTVDMVTGFNPALATVAHRETPLEQTLTVTFMGYQKTYKIQVKFSDLSLINLRAGEMKSLNWTSSQLPSECTEQMGENALKAMEVYFAMPDGDVKNIPEGNVEEIAKVATMYGLSKWQAAFASYKDAFYLRDGTTLTWDCSDIEKTEAAYQNILNKDPVLYDDAALLLQMKEKFPDVKIYEDDTLADMLAPVYSPETIDEFAEQLGLMIGLHNALKDIPDDWTLDMLKADYADEIQNAWVMLYETGYTATQHRPLYLLVSNWRTKNDYFEILYEYYYNHEDENEADKINDFKDLRLPGELEVLYNYLLEVKNCIIYMQNGMLFESSQFMFSYDKALEKRDEILASGNEMWIDLYETLEFDYMVGDGQGGYKLSSFEQLFQSFRSAPMGYLHHFNAYLGIEEFENLWNDYMSVLKSYGNKISAENKEPDITEFGTEIESLLKDYLALSPKQQFAFMVMLQPYYLPSAQGRYPLYTWETDGETYHNEFVGLIYRYYNAVLPESTHIVFSQLMLASEALANLQIADTITSFLDAMTNVNEAIEDVSREDWEAFNDIADWLVIKYQDLDEKFGGLRQENGSYTKEELSAEERKDFDALLKATSDAYRMMTLYQINLQAGRANLSMAFYATMEKVEAISSKILSSNNPRILRAYYFDEMTLPDQWLPNPQANGAWMPMTWGGTMDFLVWLVRDVYVDSLTGASYLKAGNLIWDSYQKLGVKDFLSDASYVYHTFLYMQLRPESDPDYKYFADEDTMVAVLADFQNLSTEQQHFLYVLDPTRMYLSAYIRFAKEINVNMGTVVEKLMEVQMMYAFYKQVPDGKEGNKTYKQFLEDKYAELMTHYNDMVAKVENEKAKDTPDKLVAKALDDFNKYFGDIFDFYKAECEALNA